MRTWKPVARHAFALHAMHRRGCCQISRAAAGRGAMRSTTGLSDPAVRRGCRPGRVRRNDRASRKPARPDARTDPAGKARRMADRYDAESTESAESHDPHREAALRILSGRPLPGAHYGTARSGSHSDGGRVRSREIDDPLYDERSNSIHQQTLPSIPKPRFSPRSVGQRPAGSKESVNYGTPPRITSTAQPAAMHSRNRTATTSST